ncbi:ankyrin repeat-containing protein [Anaeramoeba ignava]|uniref:Ankyrin repeat-containing protein n=1 Tax=Anaeramoeba ignava TaxID=1746090 RepID=A0A9Q0LLW4_ANAIG|nr:ankyrin repeat-containing protein [Anaeramoeba ignava]
MDFEIALRSDDLEKIEKFLPEKVNDYIGLTPIQIACKHQLKEEIIDKIIKSGADLLKKTQESVLHFACLGRVSFSIFSKLVKNGADINAVNGGSILHYACFYKVDPQIIKFLIDSDVDVNQTTGKNALHFSVEKSNFDGIRLLVEAGCDQNQKDNKTPLFLAGEKEKKVIKCSNSYVEDFLRFYERKEFTDVTIKCRTGEIMVHKFILKARISQDETVISRFLTICKKYDYVDIDSFVLFLYGKNFKIPSSETEKFSQIVKDTGLEENWLVQKSGKRGLINDLRKIYYQDQNKDFTIIVVSEFHFKIHKVVLIIRSELYRGMFLTVKDSSDQVNDYSGKSQNAIKALIEFLYFDEFLEQPSDEVFRELYDAIDYYQLNVNSNLLLILGSDIN